MTHRLTTYLGWEGVNLRIKWRVIFCFPNDNNVSIDILSSSGFAEKVFARNVDSFNFKVGYVEERT